VRLEGSKGLREERFWETTPFCDGLVLGKCFLGLRKKRKARAEAKAPKTVAVETRASSREFMEFDLEGSG
jgi:hypothetical protein